MLNTVLDALLPVVVTILIGFLAAGHHAFSKTVFAVFRAGALVCVILLFSGLGLAQKVVTARATIPFNFWALGHEFQVGDYVFDNEVPGFATIHREGSNSSRTVSVAVLAEPEPARLIFVPQDGKHFLVEIWAKDLTPANEIVIIGHATGKSNAADFLKEYLKTHHPDISRRVIAIKSADLSAVTEPEIEALAKRHMNAVV